tara:strand:+ start:454 stop:765 length:312 start_codon:yes stop_codon:yes gene_type:complete
MGNLSLEETVKFQIGKETGLEEVIYRGYWNEKLKSPKEGRLNSYKAILDVCFSSTEHKKESLIMDDIFSSEECVFSCEDMDLNKKCTTSECINYCYEAYSYSE